MLDGDAPVYADVAGDECFVQPPSLTIFCDSPGECLLERCALQVDERDLPRRQCLSSTEMVALTACGPLVRFLVRLHRRGVPPWRALPLSNYRERGPRGVLGEA
ncbi:hypothetical protein CDL15_Pgr009139 [Punica granatum]|uniref:Uncharacterized protein n=1 Tax=Punica granatum TaxID=22663 RepID=A0A218WKX1_PUNGR|nr:hypothetical protein CDL15_Pgr009139 [Punica granatum]PKI68955.1 hypothetical protein CRG98_010635 [Punica granatum]